MSIFFKEVPNKVQGQEAPQQATTRQATPLAKAMTFIVTASMVNLTLLPAHAAAGNEKAQQALLAQPVGDNAYDKIVNLSTKYQLEKEAYQNKRKAYLEGRNIFRKTIDGITSLFTDNSEIINSVDPEKLQTKKTQLLLLQSKLITEQDLLNQELAAQAEQMKKTGFTEQDLAEHSKLSDEINARFQQLDGLFEQLDAATDATEILNIITTITTKVDEWQPESRQTDVENLPWGMPKNDVREPIVSEADLNSVQNLFSIDKIGYNNYKQHVNDLSEQPYSAIHQWRNTEYKFAQLLEKSISNNGFVNTNGSFAGSPTSNAGQWTVLKSLPAEVQPADTAANEDVQITDAIKAKAAELDNNPAKIYKWVHDNVVYVPTYGSIQGSDYTLQTLRGNAFDTASLLIALLRASDIPARYVYGTVDVAAEQAMDWVGGVENIDAAQNLLGQGGVPSVAVMDGSVAKTLRLEHVWVEANINAISRGSAHNKSVNNQAQWLPLDASYKSYIRTDGVDLEEAVPFDAEAFVESAKEGATIDEETGSVKNLNKDAVNKAIEDYQDQVMAYIENNYADATIGDVLGTDKIKQYKSDILSPILPYKVKTVVSDYQTLPDSMRHYFVVNLYQDISERNMSVSLGDNPDFHVKIPTTQLQGKPLALSFKPASEADEQKILNSLPTPDENGDIDPSKIPAGFSRYLNMTAQVTLDGEEIKVGNTYGFGTEVYSQLGYQSPSTGVNYIVNTGNGLSNKTVRAGEYHAIGYDMQGLSKEQLKNIQNTLETTNDKIEDYKANANVAVLDGVTKHDITGSILQATVQSYFAMNDIQDAIAVTNSKKVISNRFLSYGTFHTFIKPNMRFGMIFGGNTTGMQMDIDKLQEVIVAKNNDTQTVARFNAVQGPRASANEHLIPEQIFDEPETDEKDVEGVSAVKAIQIASEQGQEIVVITKDNYNQLVGKLNLSADVMQDIKNAINADKEVTTHVSNINFNGWNGSGYIILDPKFGVGAYLISGSANGAMMTGVEEAMKIKKLGLMGYLKDAVNSKVEEEIKKKLATLDELIEQLKDPAGSMVELIKKLTEIFIDQACLLDSQKVALKAGIANLESLDEAIGKAGSAAASNLMVFGKMIGFYYITLLAFRFEQINLATGECEK